jgi:hypothetical protein
MGSIRNRTLYDARHHGFGVRITCSCGHRAIVEPSELIGQLLGKRGVGGLGFDQIKHKLACSACGGRPAEVRSTYEPR